MIVSYELDIPPSSTCKQEQWCHLQEPQRSVGTIAHFSSKLTPAHIGMVSKSQWKKLQESTLHS